MFLIRIGRSKILNNLIVLDVKTGYDLMAVVSGDINLLIQDDMLHAFFEIPGPGGPPCF